MPRKSKPARPRAIKEITMVGREWHFSIDMGRGVSTVIVTAKEFNRMMDDLVQLEAAPKSVLDKMAEICRRNLRKGRVVKKLRTETLTMLKDGYAEHFGAAWETITARDKHAAYIEMRMLVCGHLSSIGYSHPEIALFFMQRDRTTIIGAVERHTDLCKYDKGMAYKAKLLADHMQGWMFSTSRDQHQSPVIPTAAQPLASEPRTVREHLESIDGGHV